MVTQEQIKKTFDSLFKESGKIIVGQKEVIEQVVIAILCDANALLEGYPGLAKTLIVRTLSQLMDLKFSRIQSTPDLMPSDITGTHVLQEEKGRRSFRFQKGPIFANMVLADEINRATPKTQSALLEAMQEKQVTVGNDTFKLDTPFFVLATQNPIEQEGSLALGEPVLINGQLKTGRELLSIANENCIAEDDKGIRLYELDAWTLALNKTGKLEKQKCLLYTLPYANEMVTITTKTGKKLTVTKNHPFLVNENGAIMWKKAEDLTKQDFLVNPAKIQVDQQKIMSHKEAVARMSQKPISKEIPFDKDFAFWIAFLLSDGSIGEKHVEAVQKNYPEALDRFVEISKKYGFNPSIRTDHTGCRYARIYSKPLVEYLHIRFGIKSGKNKGIPGWFLSMPSEMNKEFLKVFISLESTLRDNRILFSQKSVRDINTISYMLLREGILSWIRHDGRIFRLKIQGKDCVHFLKEIGWVSKEKTKNMNLNRTIKSSFRVVPVERSTILKLVGQIGANSFHTIKEKKSITSRPWYGSYRGIKEGEIVMSVDSLKKFVKDIKNEIEFRKTEEFSKLLDSNPREFAANIGTPMTEISEQLDMSKNQVWDLYKGENATCAIQIKSFLKEKHSACIKEAEKMLKYCETLLSEDIYYDKIKSIRYTNSQGMAFGLTVPGLQNYLAGFGGCGINHNTYPLPEAQADRFLFKIKTNYPDPQEEEEIVKRFTGEGKLPDLKKILNKSALIALQKFVKKIPVSKDIQRRVVNIVNATRKGRSIIEYGASPRASMGLVLAAKARALVNGRNHVTNSDINEMAYPVLRHRIILNFEAERKGITPDDAVKEILRQIK